MPGKDLLPGGYLDLFAIHGKARGNMKPVAINAGGCDLIPGPGTDAAMALPATGDALEQHILAVLRLFCIVAICAILSPMFVVIEIGLGKPVRTEPYRLDLPELLLVVSLVALLVQAHCVALAADAETHDFRIYVADIFAYPLLGFHVLQRGKRLARPVALPRNLWRGQKAIVVFQRSVGVIAVEKCLYTMVITMRQFQFGIMGLKVQLVAFVTLAFEIELRHVLTAGFRLVAIRTIKPHIAAIGTFDAILFKMDSVAEFDVGAFLQSIFPVQRNANRL